MERRIVLVADNSKDSNKTFNGWLTQEQIMKIVFEEFSKSGFQFNDFNNIMSSIISRMMKENGAVAGNYLMDMFIKGIMGNFGKR